ncbi:HAMP domain-containing sensor histidine kinase [Bacillus sp. REN10]|uniref:HAMP domain-containing sensor histidine kinase n=1 Tax=Bacillus sp. REN10 TaxID=2782541 RepID=UPI00193B8CF7|nr:HAMP domain-containing sensor histidine kinase [Bacillus sp. REN10]
MGKVNRNNQTLRRRFIASFHLVLFKSIVGTILTWLLLVLYIHMLFSTNKLNPANYYEQQLPAVEKYIDDVGASILSSNSQGRLESVIPIEGIDYQVMDLDGQIVYGTYWTKLVGNGEELKQNIAAGVTTQGGGFIKYYPIKNDQGLLQGAVVFKYGLSLLTSNPHNKWMILFLGMVLLFVVAPFMFFYLFSYFSGKRLSWEFERPFNEMIESTKKIKEQDLDFTLPVINYYVELEQLTQAFEEMRSALKDSLNRQLQLEQERKEMMAAISHDLRNPLTIIQGHAEGLLESRKRRQERLEPYLQTIIRNTNYASHLIAELNEMALIEKPTFTLNPKKTSINQFVQMKGEEYQRLCVKKCIDFQYRMINEDEIYMRMIDQERISQVLDNIVTNSIRYTPANGKIEWIITMNPDQSISFDIFDNGPGFSSEQKQRVFYKYYQEESKKSGENGLSGLGLYIAKEIVKKHRGEINVNNREIGGAHVKVRICEL